MSIALHISLFKVTMQVEVKLQQNLGVFCSQKLWEEDRTASLGLWSGPAILISWLLCLVRTTELNARALGS